ncbi:MAG: hypothetical protein KAT70_04940, partial [Thermoplasmata archaeon]|nr:hypothetical protein [Thermoplasmata archaeon]
GDALMGAFRSGTFQLIGAAVLVAIVLWAFYVFWYKKRGENNKLRMPRMPGKVANSTSRNTLWQELGRRLRK